MGAYPVLAAGSDPGGRLGWEGMESGREQPTAQGTLSAAPYTDVNEI